MSTAVHPAADITVTAPTVRYEGGAVMTPMAMIDRAIQNGAGIETLERLMALQERWEASEAKREFDEAISNAKAEIRPISKTRHAGFDLKGGGRTEYDYETLPVIAAAVDPILTKYGLSYRYQAKTADMIVTVTCIISHRRGHREETTLTAGSDNSGSKNHIQAIGSAVTYLQRYTLKLALGLSAAKDDDGGATSNPELAQEITNDQYREVIKLLEDSNSREGDMLAYVGADDITHMTLAQYAKAKAAMVHKINIKKQKAAK